MARPNTREKNIRTIIIVAIVLAIVAFIIVRVRAYENAPDARVGFAQCLTEKGTKMYGAYWCPHCQAQKKQFGKAFSKVDYVECAVPGNNAAQTQVCKDQNIEGYPTWIFADGTRVTGEQTFQALGEKSGCVYEESTGETPSVTY